uniref:Uncharacterized protein n=1 Tax=Oryza glaberrima TaxID=4538 RepID=A0A679BBP8_ORYGL|nr:hypothetical protein [Oryza glaberrima]
MEGALVRSLAAVMLPPPPLASSLRRSSSGAQGIRRCAPGIRGRHHGRHQQDPTVAAAEEQRNTTRLWRQQERDVRATLDLASPATTKADVHDAMDRVLALDAAYPLPLLPIMLGKFPKAVEPAR